MLTATLPAAEDKLIYPLIPEVKSLVSSSESFIIPKNLTLHISSNDNPCDLLKALDEILSSYTVLENKGHAHIAISTQNESIAPEGYILDISPQKIAIEASSVKGAFWALQTLRQLIIEDQGTIPCAHIEDAPRFPYRGLHLDVSRHMFPISFIKRYIDLLSSYKLNTFHWHLTDDQGWRIQIKKYPRLQEIAAFRKRTIINSNTDETPRYDETRYGGYYTQDEIKDLVEYARSKQVTIIPEIEMPGHSLSPLAAYPELGCTGGPYDVACEWVISEDIFCAGNDKVFEFLENVLTEVIELFPSPYIHIGGDEAPKTAWEKCSKCQLRIKNENLKNEFELQSYFIQRIEKFLNAKGRSIIGWDEILQGGLAPNATVMSWTRDGLQGAIESARLKHPVIMTPQRGLYFDHYQSKEPGEPLAIGGFNPLSRVYNYSPIPEELTADEAFYIKGVQANVWTEFMQSPAEVEYMVYPRALALAEMAWTQNLEKDFEAFLKRAHKHLPKLKKLGVNYRELEAL